jgi:hypothetical protein
VASVTDAASAHLAAQSHATLLSAQMVQRSERALGTGHERGRSQELLSPFGATAPAPGSGMIVTGPMSSIIHERQDWYPSSS